MDGPPILPMADMNLYAEIVDGILLVVRVEKTPQRVVIEALEFLEGRKIEGVVLNGLVNMRGGYYSGYTSSRYTIAEPPLLLHQPGSRNINSPPSLKGTARGRTDA